MKKQIYVIGHRNPDTDSVASAIAYALFAIILVITAVQGIVSKRWVLS